MIIAEIGSVHDGSLGNAKLLALAAKNCGAQYAKFQMHLAEYETLKNAPSPKYFKTENRYKYFKRTNFSDENWIKLINFCKKNKIKFLCSVFSIEAAKKLLTFGVKEIKIPSGELTNTPLLKYISKKKITIFLSTGMSDWKEIDTAIKILKKNKIILMQCSSIYPCPVERVGLNVLEQFKKKYKSPKIDFGFSDHTQGHSAAILSLKYGANYIEKHITFSKLMYGSDAKLAMNLEDFKHYCKNINEAKKLIKFKVNKNNLNNYSKMKKIFEKSIYFNLDLKKNTIINFKHLSFKKPANGILAKDFEKIIGKKLKKDFKKNQKLNFNLFY